MGRVNKKMNKEQVMYMKFVIIKYIQIRYNLEKDRKYTDGEIYCIFSAIPKSDKKGVWVDLAAEVSSTPLELAKFFHHFFQKGVFPQALDKKIQKPIKQFILANMHYDERKMLKEVCLEFPEIHPKRLKAFTKTFMKKIQDDDVLYRMNQILNGSFSSSE